MDPTTYKIPYLLTQQAKIVVYSMQTTLQGKEDK